MKLIDTVKPFVGAWPVSIQTTGFDNTTYLLGDSVNVENYGHVTIILIGGAFGGASGAVTIKQSAADDISVSSDNVPISYRYLCTATSAASATWTKTAITSNTWTWPATNYLANIVEFDTAVLNADHNFVAVNVVAAGTGSSLLTVLYLLSEPRYITAETDIGTLMA
jgi:hypothetical protein